MAFYDHEMACFSSPFFGVPPPIPFLLNIQTGSSLYSLAWDLGEITFLEFSDEIKLELINPFMLQHTYQTAVFQAGLKTRVDGSGRSNTPKPAGKGSRLTYISRTKTKQFVGTREGLPITTGRSEFWS